MSRSAGGFVLLLIGAVGLIGFLTGNLDRWLAFLFSPSSSSPVAPMPVPAGAPTSASGNNRTGGGGKVA